MCHPSRIVRDLSPSVSIKSPRLLQGGLDHKQTKLGLSPPPQFSASPLNMQASERSRSRSVAGLLTETNPHGGDRGGGSFVGRAWHKTTTSRDFSASLLLKIYRSLSLPSQPNH